MRETTLVGIAGGSGAGKTTLAWMLVAELRTRGVHAETIAFDSYYRDQSHLEPRERAMVNYDHPDSLEGELLAAHLAMLAEGRHVEVPAYDFATHTRRGQASRLDPARVVIVDGILLFAFEELARALDMRIFVDAPEHVRLERRIRRDVVERGRSADDVRRQFTESVAPMHDRYVAPHARAADRLVTVDDDFVSIADAVARDLAAVRAEA